MTRGYVVLFKNGKPYKVVYAYSGAYVEDLGLDILNLFENGTLESAFSKVREVGFNLDTLTNEDAISSVIYQYGEDKEYNSENVSKDDLIKSSKNKDDFFEQYSYIYDINKDVLKVYYYGELLYTITRADIDKYKYIFKNEGALYRIFSYDEKRCSLSKDFHKEIRKYLKKETPSIEDLSSLILNKKVGLTINVGKCSDVWGDGAYQKFVQNERYNDVAKFIISKEFGRYKLAIQLPYIRNTIFTGNTAAACEKELVRLVKEQPNKLNNFKLIFDFYNDYKNQLEQLRKDVDESDFIEISGEILNKFSAGLEMLTKNEYLRTHSFNLKEIKNELRDKRYYLLKSYKKEERVG